LKRPTKREPSQEPHLADPYIIDFSTVTPPPKYRDKVEEMEDLAYQEVLQYIERRGLLRVLPDDMWRSGAYSYWLATEWDRTATGRGEGRMKRSRHDSGSRWRPEYYVLLTETPAGRVHYLHVKTWQDQDGSWIVRIHERRERQRPEGMDPDQKPVATRRSMQGSL
jgi:hypothetical protein